MPTSTEPDPLVNATLRTHLTPDITFIKPFGVTQNVPDNADAGGFSFAADISLPYHALSNVLQTFLLGKRLQLSEGFINQHLVLEGCKLYYLASNALAAEVPFSGSHSGTFYLTGMPFYNQQSQHIELQNVAYDLKTKSLVLKGAKWLFGKLILDEIKKISAVNLAPLYQKAAAQLTAMLNKEWSKGIEASGRITELLIKSFSAQPTQLLVQAQCRGIIKVTITESELKF